MLDSMSSHVGLRAWASEGSEPKRDPDSSASGQKFYRYTDKNGRLVIVDSPDKLPKSALPHAEEVQLQEGPSAVERLQATQNSQAATGFSLPSFAFGLGLALLLVVLALVLKRAGALFIAKILAIVAVVAALGGLYLGLLRKSTGQSDALLASPQDIIDDAKRTVEKANESQHKRQEMLDEIGREGK